MFFWVRVKVVFKSIVIIFIKDIIYIIEGIMIKRGRRWVIRKIFVVIIVVVCIRVEMGVGFFMVLGNYIWRGNCVDLVIGFINNRNVYKVRNKRFILLFKIKLLNILNKFWNLKLLVI